MKNLFHRQKPINKPLYDYLHNLLGKDVNAFARAPDPPVSIRINTLKTTQKSVTHNLRNYRVSYKPHPYNPDAYILQDDFLPISHTLDFFLGHVTYQGVASQLPVLALNPQPEELVLDIAAAPGSKSTQIAALMQNRGQLFLNDVSRRRMQPLLTNLSRNGVINDVVFNLPGQRFGRLFANTFDRVLLDAPCSNLGKLPGQLYSNARLSIKAAQEHTDLQYHLLLSALKAVKINGRVVYSTCSLAVEENEKVIDRVLRRYPQAVAVQPCDLPDSSHFHQGLVQYNGTALQPQLQLARRLYPFSSPTEGFFMACLQKTDELSAAKTSIPFTRAPLLSSRDPAVHSVLQNMEKMWGIDSDILKRYRYRLTQKKCWLIAPQWHSVPECGFYKAGLPLAVRKKQGWKLTNAGVQCFAPHISKRLLHLNKASLIRLFKQGEIDWHKHAAGYYILVYEGKKLGTVSLFNHNLKIRLPHRFNLIV